MNKVFRVIWSRATQSWVAVSELTKAHKKQSSSNAQKSAVKFSGNFIKSSAIALTLLSGHSAYAADAASGLIQINSTGTATASGSESIAVGKDSKATSDTAVAIGKDAEASGKQSVALGNKAKATGENSYAIGWGSNASHPRSISIGYNSAARHNNSLALGYNTIASGPSSVALGAGSNALGDDSYAIGYGSKTNTGANFAMAFGNSSKANKANDIAFGKEAETRDQGQGHSIAIGYGAMSGTNNAGKNLNGGDAGGVAIGTGAYTGVNKTNISLNSSVAVGAGAGAGFRKLDTNGMPVQNATDVDNNDEVLKKAFGVKNVADYQKIAGGTNGYTNVAINEATALGRNARAIGDQSVAIGAQTIAGMGAIALGGNDITQFANNKYYKSIKENFAATETEDHNQDAEISKDTISGAYKRLVGTKLDTAYKATYAQDGSVVLGAQAHSGTPLGTALGTNALVRKGAFGATAIGAGSQVQANAEAAVAIGMGSFANGKYAVAAGTAAKAEESAVAAGYQANADKSAVAVGDHSKAVEASVAVGQGAQAKNVADIAIGQGAVASGKQGAIAMGLGTNAQGDSSIMIGGADVDSASKQSTTFEKAIGVNEKGGVIAKDVVEKINGKEVTRHYTFAATKTTTGTVAAAFQELTGHAMDVATLNFADTKNKNGHASTSLGVHSLAKGDLATAIGASARADVIGSLALGTGAHATRQNAVAIGTGSTTELLGTRQLSVNYDSEGNIVSDDSKDIAYTFKWAGGTNTSEGDVVSFGSSGAERQLKNVAAGRVAEDSTDAINGSQLNSITKKIAAGFNTSGNVVADSSGVFTSKKANTDSADKAYETAIRSQDKVQLQVGNNLKLDRDETEVEIEVQDDFDKTKTVKKKVKKADFAYSLNPVLTNLTSAEFKADGKPTVNISSDGITITPAAPTTGGEQKPNVSLTENGLNNGGNTITNVAGNLNGAKKDTDAPKTNAAAPNTTDKNGDKYINPNNAATVGDVLNAGWNLQGNGTAKDFVTAYDIVNFIDGEGTSVSVENTDNKTSTIKYSVNLGDGLEKDATTNKIKAKAGDGVTVGADGIKVNTGKGLKIDAADNNKVAVNTDGTTITVGTDGKVKAVTGSTEAVTDTNKGTDEKAGQVRPVKADKGKLATVDAVANAVNNAAWSITSDTDGGSFATSGHTKTTEKISAGGSVTFKAGDNLIIKQKGTDFTYSLNPILNGLTSAEFKGTGENAPITKLTNAGITVTTPADAVANTPEKTVTLNQDGLNNGGNAISNVKSNLPATKNSDTANTAAAPSNATKTQAVPNTTNTKGTDYVNPNNAATVGDVLNAGWNLKGKGTAVDFVKAYDTVDFVDGDGTTASVESKDGQTSTVKYSVNTTTITADTANAGKVKAEGTGNTFATAETVASAINDAYWKAAASGNGVTTDTADNVKAGDTVTFKAGKNLTVTHTNKSFEFATTDTPEFSSVQFGDKGPKITRDGDNLKVTKADGTSPTKITNVANGDGDNDAVNVSQLKASGWKVAGNNKTEVDTINPDEQVNFLNGSGTTVSVTKDTDKAGKETGNVNVKYDVNVGNGLQKDTTGNTISVKPADSTITVGANGVKVNTGDIATESTGKATTALDKAIADATKELADATKAGDTAAQQKAQEKLAAANAAKTAAGKQIATVENVTEAINKAGWNAIAAKTVNGEVSGVATQLVKPGETVIFEADKNIKIAQNGSKFTFSTKDNVEFKSVKVGEEKDGKKPVSLTTEVAKPADNNQTGKAPTTALNISSGAGKDAKPTQITGVGSVLNATTVTSAPDGTAPANQPKLVNLGTAHGQTALDNNILNSAATVRDLANMGWKVSADKVTGADDKSYSDVVRNADEVKFVGTNAAKVSGKTVNGVRTITVDVEVPDVKTAKLVSSTDGSVIAPSTDSKFQDALKTAKDELAALSKDATDKQKKEAEKKVKDAETALNNALDDKGVATAKNVADMINNSGFTLKTSKAEGGNKDTASVGSEVINPGKTVEMVAGKNLTVKQDAGGKVTYSLNPELINLTSAEFKANGKPTVNISSDGIVITPNSKTSPTVSLTENGLNNGGNAITNVAGNLPSTKNNDAAATDPSNATKSQAAPTLGNTANQVNPTNAATVSDVLNAGWNLQGNGNAVDFVKPYDTVNFVNGDGTSVAVESEDGKTSTVKYSANLGDGLEKTGDNKIKVKAADKSLEVTNEGVKVKAADNTLTTDTNGLKVNTGSITTAAVPTVTAGDENKIATVGNVADAIKAAAWNATSAATTSGENTGTKVQPVKAGETVTFEADKNIKIAQADGKFTFSTKDNVEFNTVKVGAPETYKDENGQSVVKANDGKFYPASKVVNGVPNKGAQEVPADKVKAENPQVSFTRKDAKLAENNDTGKVPSTALDVSSTDGKPTQITGVGSTLNVKPVDTNPNGTATTGNARPNLIDLVGTDAKAVNKNAAATVGDLQNMGWVVSSDKATGTTGEYKDVVKNANEVRFVGEGTAVVSGKTDGNVRTITVKVNDQVSTNNAVTPVVYTKEDGTKVYPVKNAQGNIEYHTTPDGKGEGDQKVDDSDVITSVNGPKGTTKPTTLSNVAGNLNGAKKDTTAPTNEAAKPDNADTIKNNAATVGDVLNAGWNLQNNGAAKDFVKPYDTVNFRDGGNTTVTVTTDDNLTSHVQVNVTGLPVSNTITDPATGKQVPVVKVGDAFYRTNPDGTPNIERNDEGEPTNGYVRANDGKLYPRDAVEVTPNAADPTQPPTITPKADAKPTTVNTNLVNPNVDNTTDNPGNNVNTPNQLGNVANGAKTFNAVDADGKDYVKANNGKYYEPSKVNADGSLKDGTDATADAKNPLVLANDGKWYPADKVSDKGTPEAGATAVENPLAPKNAAGQPLVRAKDGKWYTPADVQPNGLPTPTAQPQDNAINNKAGLVDFANSNPNNAATIGDLQNMGWVVSAPGNSYSDQVRNANEVQFVGEGTAIVTGKTDDKGVRTITVKVDNQVSTNNSVTPVVYTDKNGNTVYPIKDDKGNVAYHTTPDGKGKGDTVVPNGDVNTSVNGPKDEQGNTRPASLGNVKNNIPAVNDVDKKVTNPDGTEKGTAGDVNNINKAPLTATEAADLLNPRKDGKPNPNFVGNNAATVSDVLNAGWNLQNNGTAKDFVKPYDTVNFINGLGTTAVVTTREGNTTSDVTFNVKAANGSVTVDEDGVKVTTGEMKPAVDANNKETGAIATSANPATAKQLKDALDAAVKELATAKDALKTAEKALEANPKDPALQQAVADKKAEVAAKQTPVDAAQKAHDEAGLNKVATVQNVAEAINNAGFNLTTSAATGGEKLKGAKNDGELIKPSNTVEMVAGKNLTVKQDDKGKITYATKDDVTFTNVNTGTLNVGSPNTYTDGKGNTYTKVGDNYYNPADVENGAPKPDATPVTIPADVVVKPVSPVTMKTEAAKPAKNNATDAQPSSALNITSKDGKPTQITGVGSTLNTNVVKTSPEGTPTTPGAAPKTEDAHLVDLKGTDAVPVNKNAAATVGDLQNMGWVVSTKDGNGYTDVVKNANKVDFKGGAGISVKGETTKDGVREITISVKDGEVVKPNQFTAKVNGTDTPVTKVGDQYYNTADIDPKTGNPKDNVTPVTPDKGTTPTNAGDGYVTGNKVAAAIQKSGFIVGKQTEKLSAADFNDKDEKVNPDDELRFADGNNTKVKLATKVSVDKDGNKVTTTTVKVDVTGLPVQYTDKNGTRVTKVGNQYFTVDDKGNPTATEVKPEDLTTNMVNPAAAPNVIGAPTTLGNVEGNLDGAKTGTTAPTDSHAAPNTADATKPNYVNTHNAATVGDVLNAGWNLQNNGKAKDFVKPYDTVNFVDGKGTKAVVETADNLTSTVKFDVDAGKITADTTKPGAVKGPADETLTKALKDAKDALAKLPKDADAATVKAAQDKVDAAQKAIDDSPNSNKVATAQNVADMINNSGFTLKADKTKGDNSTAADLANGEMIHPGDTITMKAGKNMSVKHEKNGSITYETKDDVNFNSLSLGDSKHAPTLSADEDGSLRLGSKNNQAPVRISNVAPGIKDGDAVNVSQLKGVTKDLEDKIDGVAAGSNAAASLPQVYLPGKSMVAASVGTYGSQGALAVGYSSISDNGKWLIKGQINVNTKAKTGGGVGVGYLW